MTRYSLIFVGMFGLAACGVPTEEELIPDSDVDAVQLEQQQSALSATSVTTANVPAPFHLRLAWGYLAGKRDARRWVDWNGGVSVDDGKVTLEHLTYFDRRDEPVPGDDPRQVSWISHTLPHFDGLIVKVEPTAATKSVTFATAAFNREFTLDSLESGVMQVIGVDAQGHELSVASVPDSAACSGFALGYERPSGAGWDAFAGRVLDQSGKPVARLRFRAEDGKITARVFSTGRELVSTGTGTLDGDKFELQVTLPDGSARVVRGQFREPSYSPRGSFQAVLSCN